MKGKYKSIALIAALAGVVVAAHVALFFIIKSMNERASAVRTDIERSAAEESRAISMNNFLRATAEVRAALDRHFVTEGTIAEFIEEVEALGAFAGIKVSLTSVDVPAKGPPALGASLRMEGTFANIHFFVSLIEALPYEMELKRLVIGKAPAALGARPDLWEGEGSIELTSFLRAKQ